MKPFEVLQAVSAHFELPLNVVVGGSRVARVVDARWCVIYICVKRFGVSRRETARVVGRTESNLAKVLPRIDWRLRNCKRYRAQYVAAVESLYVADRFFKAGGVKALGGVAS